MDFDEFVLAASTADLGDEPQARPHADIVEFRLDLATEPLEQLDGYDGSLPLLVTNRREEEGGGAAETPDRLALLADALAHDAVAAIDVELATIEGAADTDPLLEQARSAGVSIVVSAHDFEGAPERVDCERILRAACSAGDIGKLAVTAQGHQDLLDLLVATTQRFQAGDRVATMAMGEVGRHSRAVLPLYGSRIGYAPVDPADATAPGQYDLATLRGLIDDLGGPAD